MGRHREEALDQAFRLNAADHVEETDPDTELDRGCKIELSEVTVRGEPWWTLAFESFGEGNRAMNLEPFALHFLKMLRWPCPCRARLDGLPGVAQQGREPVGTHWAHNGRARTR